MDEIKRLVEKGRSQGYVSYLEFKACLPSDEIIPEQIEDIIQMLSDMGIEVRMDKAEVINLKGGLKDE